MLLIATARSARTVALKGVVGVPTGIVVAGIAVTVRVSVVVPSRAVESRGIVLGTVVSEGPVV